MRSEQQAGHGARQGGFTIIELMIVLVIAAIIAAIAVPSFRSNIANQRAKAGAQQIMLALQQARSEAMKFNGGCTVALVPVSSADFALGWSIVAYNPGTTSACSRDLDLDGTNETIGTLQQTGLIEGVDAVPFNGGAATTISTINYNRSGRVTAPASINAYEIRVCDDDDLGRQRTVAIDISGAPSVELAGNC